MECTDKSKVCKSGNLVDCTDKSQNSRSTNIMDSADKSQEIKGKNNLGFAYKNQDGNAETNLSSVDTKNIYEGGNGKNTTSKSDKDESQADKTDKEKL